MRTLPLFSLLLIACGDKDEIDGFELSNTQTTGGSGSSDCSQSADPTYAEPDRDWLSDDGNWGINLADGFFLSGTETEDDGGLLTAFDGDCEEGDSGEDDRCYSLFGVDDFSEEGTRYADLQASLDALDFPEEAARGRTDDGACYAQIQGEIQGYPSIVREHIDGRGARFYAIIMSVNDADTAEHIAMLDSLSFGWR